jgi:carbamoyl-phosphate synthase large subunit
LARLPDDNFPLFTKPDIGYGSRNSSIVRDRESLNYAFKNDADEKIVLEYLPGEEFTIDCFSDLNHKILFAGARKRSRTRVGISVATEITEVEEASVIAEKISQALKMNGAWFFQLKRASK